MAVRRCSDASVGDRHRRRACRHRACRRDSFRPLTSNGAVRSDRSRRCAPARRDRVDACRRGHRRNCHRRNRRDRHSRHRSCRRRSHPFPMLHYDPAARRPPAVLPTRSSTPVPARNGAIRHWTKRKRVDPLSVRPASCRCRSAASRYRSSCRRCLGSRHRCRRWRIERRWSGCRPARSMPPVRRYCLGPSSPRCRRGASSPYRSSGRSC